MSNPPIHITIYVEILNHLQGVIDSANIALMGDPVNPAYWVERVEQACSERVTILTKMVEDHGAEVAAIALNPSLKPKGA